MPWKKPKLMPWEASAFFRLGNPEIVLRIKETIEDTAVALLREAVAYGRMSREEVEKVLEELYAQREKSRRNK